MVLSLKIFDLDSSYYTNFTASILLRQPALVPSRFWIHIAELLRLLREPSLVELWVPTKAPHWRPRVSCNRTSEPRWRTGRWRSKTHKGRQV